ncbi:MAG: TonB-dependent receptor [Candidatus Zixiibacteriota bacterium]
MGFTIKTGKLYNLQKLVLIALGAVMLFTTSAFAAGGKIAGKIVDAESGEAMVGVTVMLEGTQTGTRSNLEGEYTISQVPGGTYTLKFTSVGYSDMKVADVIVSAGKVQHLDVSMEMAVIEGKEVTVTAKRVQGTDAAVLADRKRATAVSDAISSTTIERTGSSDAGDAVKKIVGAAVTDGKYVNVRGIGGRYNNTTLNGMPMPSADPDKNAVQMDLMPAKLLDKVVVKKTFTPDQYGDFTGGSVDLGTKAMPEEFTLVFSQSAGYNSKTTGKNGFLTQNGGSTDWLGIDDGSRAVPDILADPSTVIPRYTQARRDADLAHQLDMYSNAMGNEMAPTKKNGPFNQGYSFTFGNQYKIDDNPLGVMASLSYSNKAKFYDDGIKNRWERPGVTDYMNSYYELHDSRGIEEVLWGGLAGVSYEPSDHHRLSARYTYSRSSEKEARYLYGDFNYEFPNSNQVFETRALKFTERYLNAFQLSGKHLFQKLESTGTPFEVEWMASYSENNVNTPDFRTFSNAVIYSDSTLTDTTGFVVQSSGVDYPTRWFGDLQERKKAVKVNLSHDLSNDPGYTGKFKAGVFAEQTRRENRELRFWYKNTDSNDMYLDADGNPFDYFSEEYTGIVDSTFWQVDSETGDSLYRYTFGNVLEYKQAEQKNATYDGQQDIYSGYGMLEIPVTQRLQIIGGGRLELTEMTVTNANGIRGDLDDVDFLPSLNVVYRLLDNMNVRAAATRTLARPSFREKMPMKTYEFNYGYAVYGNPDLERTLISNYDLRWEYFVRPGEILAVSGYYKYFDKPITRFIVDVNGNLEPRNVDYGKILGLEFEFRSRLDRIAGFLGNFTLGGNVSFITSEIRVGDAELKIARGQDPNYAATRDMEGQSDYLVNIDLGFESRRSGTTMDMQYNVFGPRMTEVSLGAAPDVYEQPFHSLNAKLSQKIFGKLKFSLSASNILNETIQKTQTLGGVVYTESEYRPGRTISVGTSYSF